METYRKDNTTKNKHDMKTYSETYMGGGIKYTVSFHDGVKTHKDGSPAKDIAIFKNKKKKEAFIKELKLKGYHHG